MSIRHQRIPAPFLITVDYRLSAWSLAETENTVTIMRSDGEQTYCRDL